MAKTTGKSGAPKAAAKGATEAVKETATKGATKALVSVKPGAMSKDVGPMVIAGLARASEDEAKAHDLIRGVQSKRYDLMAQTTQAIVKAAKADQSIDLTATFAGDAKKMNTLNDQLGLALGFREVVNFGPSDDPKQRIVYAKAVSKYFPTGKDVKGTPETRKKATLRSNFLHMLKKCAQAAVAINERGIKMEMDKDEGTLLLSGPAIQKQFGAAEVLLNEKQTVGDGKDSVKLNEKPSFTALAASAAQDHGAAVKRGSTSRQAKIGSNKPEDVIAAQCSALIASVGKITGEPTDKMIESLTAVQSALDNLLGLG